MCKDSKNRIDYVNENITLIQRKEGLTFGSDAYLLYAYMKRFGGGSVGAELGGGCGIISLLAASKGKLSKIYSVELMTNYSKLIALNAKNNSLEDKVIPLNIDVRELTLAHVGNKEVDAVFTNPPYLKGGSGIENANDEMNAARRELCGNIGDFCAAASRILKFSGYFYAVYRPERLPDLFEAMRNNGIEPKRMTLVFPDFSKASNLVLVEGRKGGRGGIFITPPLVMHHDASKIPLTDTDELRYIYENGEFDERYRKP